MDARIEQLRLLARQEGAALCGVADVSALKAGFLELSDGALQGVDRAVCIAFHLSDPVLEDLSDGPTKLYYFHYQRANILLDAAALRVTEFIQSLGWRALPIPASQIVDWEHQRAHVSHKHVARQAGLGWIGRNNLLVTPQYGARVRLVTVLTDMPLPPGDPLAQGCGTCRACVGVCPAGAIKERPEDFDHVGCYEKIREMVKARGIGQNICGLCVKACRGFERAAASE
jgi:epoxyqueuosine reductase QueG